VIIPCRQCHTRFKVPDGKVKARGLKVRCSRCGHTFRIYPDSESKQGGDPAPAAARPRGPDPFDAFAPAGTSDMEKTPERGNATSALLAKLAPAPAGDDFDVDVSGVEPASTEPAWNFPPAPSGPAAAAVALQVEPPEALTGPSAGVAVARSAVVVAVPVRPLSPAAAPEPFPDEQETSPHLPVDPVESFRPVPVRPLPAAPSSGLANLFDDQLAAAELPGSHEGAGPAPGAPLTSGAMGDLASLAGFTPAWGLASPSRALSVDGILSHHTPSLSPAAEPVAPPPAPQFGGEGTVLDDLPSLEPGPLPAHGEIELDAGSSAPDWSGIGGAALGGNQIDLESEFPAMELDRRPAPELASAPVPEPPWALAALSAAPQSAPDPPPPADLDWMPEAASAPSAPTPAPAAALGWDDPFSEPPPPPRSPSPPIAEAPAQAGRPEAPNAVLLDEAPLLGPRSPDDFFEMPGSSDGRAPIPTGALLPDIPETVEPPAAPVLSTVSGPMPSLSKPPGRIRLGLQERELPGTARQVSAVILNVGLAGLLLLVVAGLVSSWATAGRVDGAALSPRRLLQTLRAGVGVTPVEVTPGTYETRSGRSLLYVRGQVQNRGAPSARVRVRAEVWDGAQAVKSGETLAGSIATPEELWRAVGPTDVEALRARLVGAAKPVADGQVADFLVLLDEAPGDLSGLRLKVTATVER